MIITDKINMVAPVRKYQDATFRLRPMQRDELERYARTGLESLVSDPYLVQLLKEQTGISVSVGPSPLNLGPGGSAILVADLPKDGLSFFFADRVEE